LPGGSGFVWCVTAASDNERSNPAPKRVTSKAIVCSIFELNT
jgi:hypothetical protein